MQYQYPVALVHEDGEFVATCRDLPEALTSGGTRDEAMVEMREAFGAAIAGYVEDGREIPKPSRREPREVLVAVSPLVVAKLEVMAAMQDKGVTNVALAERLGVTETVVRRILDLDHNSRWDRVQSALDALGGTLVVSARRPAVRKGRSEPEPA